MIFFTALGILVAVALVTIGLSVLGLVIQDRVEEKKNIEYSKKLVVNDDSGS